MKVLSIVSQKGGTGKTTLATHLSVEAERNGHTIALIDLDPQASAAKWGDHREADLNISVTWLGVREILSDCPLALFFMVLGIIWFGLFIILLRKS